MHPLFAVLWLCVSLIDDCVLLGSTRQKVNDSWPASLQLLGVASICNSDLLIGLILKFPVY